MEIFNITTLFLLSLGITFILCCLLAYNFKRRMDLFEEKNDKLFEIVKNTVSEITNVKQMQNSLFYGKPNDVFRVEKKDAEEDNEAEEDNDESEEEDNNEEEENNNEDDEDNENKSLSKGETVIRKLSDNDDIFVKTNANEENIYTDFTNDNKIKVSNDENDDSPPFFSIHQSLPNGFMNRNENNGMENMNMNMNIRDFRDLDFQLMNLFPPMQRQMYENYNPDVSDVSEVVEIPFKISNEELKINSIDELPPFEEDFSYFTSAQEAGEPTHPIHCEDVGVVSESVDENVVESMIGETADDEVGSRRRNVAEPRSGGDNIESVIENVEQTNDGYVVDLDDCVSILSITEKPNNDNYNKMNLQSLKLLVVSRGLTNDANKMKKNEIIKMLKTADSINA